MKPKKLSKSDDMRERTSVGVSWSYFGSGYGIGRLTGGEEWNDFCNYESGNPCCHFDWCQHDIRVKLLGRKGVTHEE